MNKKLYSLLCSNFNKTKDREQYEMLEEIFKEYDAIYLEKAIKKIINEDKYMPSVARIKEMYNEAYFEELTEDEKLKRWEKEGIVPSCTLKTPSDAPMNEEELKELQEDWELLFG